MSGIIRRHRASIGSPWRTLNPGQQALLVLAYLRQGETFAELATGFGVGTASAWRYVTEVVALLAARAPKLRKAARDAGSTSWSSAEALEGPLGQSGLLQRHRPAPEGLGQPGPIADAELDIGVLEVIAHRPR